MPDIFALPEIATVNDGVLSISLKDAHQLASGDMVRLITEINTQKEVVVTVRDEFCFTVNDWTESAERLFVYGKQVDDFRILNYDHIFCAGISAIQELSKQVTEQKHQMVGYEARLLQFETQSNN